MLSIAHTKDNDDGGLLINCVPLPLQWQLEAQLV